MAEVLRARAFSFDSDDEHDVVFLTGTATPGSKFKVLLDAAGTISAAAPLGDASGTVNLEDFVPDYVGFGTSASAYELVGVTAAHTGIRFTVSGGGVAGLLLEVLDDDGIDGEIVVRAGGGDPDLDIDLTTSADDSIGAAFFWAFGFSSFTPDANNTSVPASESTVAVYTGALGAAGAKTAGGTLDTGAYNYGFGVAYLNAAAPPPSGILRQMMAHSGG